MEEIISTTSKMRTALIICSRAFKDLSLNYHFADDAPEFNEGGVGYEASQACREALGEIRTDEIRGTKTDSQALVTAILALRQLSEHPAFEGDAPEFNEAGIGYIALQVAKEALDAVPEETSPIEFRDYIYKSHSLTVFKGSDGDFIIEIHGTQTIYLNKKKFRKLIKKMKKLAKKG